MSERDPFAWAPAWARVALRLLTFLLLFFTFALLILGGLGLIDRSLLTNIGSLRTQIVNAWSMLIAVVAAHAVMVRWVDRRTWSEMGLGREQARPRIWLPALAIGGVAIAIPSLLLWGVHWLREEQVTAAVSWGYFLLRITALLLPAAFFEELLMRGYPFALLRRAAGAPTALIGTSVVFGMIHWFNPGATPRSLLLVMLAGVFLGGILLATGSLYAAGAAHFAWNWVMAALLHTPVSGLAVSAPAYRLADSGPAWATGGSWGPEGGAGAAAGMLVALGFLYRQHLMRRGAERQIEDRSSA